MVNRSYKNAAADGDRDGGGDDVVEVDGKISLIRVQSVLIATVVDQFIGGADVIGYVIM